MSREELKKEIDNSLNYLSNDALEEILSYLKKIENNQSEDLKREIALIFEQDRGLLQRLAQ